MSAVALICQLHQRHNESHTLSEVYSYYKSVQLDGAPCYVEVVLMSMPITLNTVGLGPGDCVLHGDPAPPLQ